MAGPTLDVAIRGPLEREDLPGLFARVCGLLERHRPDIVRCEVGDVAVDAVALDALARLALAARRHGCEVRLHGADDDLRGLVSLAGLDDVLRCDPTGPAAGAGRRAETASRWRGRT